VGIEIIENNDFKTKTVDQQTEHSIF